MERLTNKRENMFGVYYGLKGGGCTYSAGSFDCDDKGTEVLQKAISKLAEYENLEEQGKLPRLRCKVGDRLYFLWECNDNQIAEMEVIEIILHKCVGNKQKNFNVIYKLAFLNREVTIHFCDDDFGKTVFFAEEEAKGSVGED